MTNAPPGIHTITGSEPDTSGDHTVTVRQASSRTFGSSRPPADERPALQRQRPVLDGVAHTRPRQQRRGRGETTLADRLLGVRHPAPDRDAALDGAAQIARHAVSRESQELRQPPGTPES